MPTSTALLLMLLVAHTMPSSMVQAAGIVAVLGNCTFSTDASGLLTRQGLCATQGGRLDLSLKDISRISPDAFRDLPLLDSLWLWGNSLQVLPSGVFSGLFSLTRLQLDNNNLQTLPTGIFDSLRSLKYLELWGNFLTDLPDGIFDRLQLRHLGLYKNNLQRLPPAMFDRQLGLTSLFLWCNPAWASCTSGNTAVTCAPIWPEHFAGIKVYYGPPRCSEKQCFNNSETNAQNTGCRCTSGYSGLDTSCSFRFEPRPHVECSSDVICVACVPGTYKSSLGSGPCSECPSGKASNVSGATKISICHICGPGTYAPASGIATCYDCPAGKYSTNSGAIYCRMCRAGTYVATQGSSAESACIMCAAGKYSTFEGAATESACRECGAGKYLESVGNDAEEDCLLCPAGRYNAEPGSIVCNGTCPVHSSSPIGSTFQINCSCVAGFFEGNKTCAACTPGTYKDTAGSSPCITCEPGTYSASAATSCSACPPFSHSASGSANCTCNNGYTAILSGVKCVPAKFTHAVKVGLSLSPMTWSSFTMDKRNALRTVIASVALVQIEAVTIDKVESVSQKSRRSSVGIHVTYILQVLCYGVCLRIMLLVH